MPAPTREQYEAMARKVAENAPAGLSREDFYRRVDAAMDQLGGAPEGAPGSTFAGDAATSLTAAARGMVNTLTSPIEAVKGIYDLGSDILTSGGQRTIKGIQRLIEEGSADELGEAVGSVGGGVIAGRVLPSVPGAMRSAMRSTPARVAGGAVRGAAENVPVVSPIVKGAYRGGKDVLDRRAAISGGRLVPRGRQPLDAFASNVEEALLKALDDTPETFRLGGPVKPLRAPKNTPVIEPEVRGGMVTTQPDKWGVTAIFPESDVDLALRGVQARGPLRSQSQTQAIRQPALELTEAEERLLRALGGRAR